MNRDPGPPLGAMAGVSLAVLIMHPLIWVMTLGTLVFLLGVALGIDWLRTRRQRRLLRGPFFLRA